MACARAAAARPLVPSESSRRWVDWLIGLPPLPLLLPLLPLPPLPVLLLPPPPVLPPPVLPPPGVAWMLLVGRLPLTVGTTSMYWLVAELPGGTNTRGRAAAEAEAASAAGSASAATPRMTAAAGFMTSFDTRETVRA